MTGGLFSPEGLLNYGTFSPTGQYMSEAEYQRDVQQFQDEMIHLKAKAGVTSINFDLIDTHAQ